MKYSVIELRLIRDNIERNETLSELSREWAMEHVQREMKAALREERKREKATTVR